MADISLSPDQIAAIDFNYQQIATSLGIPIPPSAAATIIGVNKAAYAAHIEAITAAVKRWALELMTDPAVANLVDRLANRGKTVLAMGDSITTCRYSYAELLRHLLKPKGVQLFNWGVGGYTSNHALELCYNTALLALKPNVIFISYGVNDGKYFGSTAKTLVSRAEYTANMSAVVGALQAQTTAQIVLLTPTPVIEALANHLPPGFHHAMRWENAELQRFGDALHEIGAQYRVPVVDLFTSFGTPPDQKFFLEDGVHPNATGERALLQHMAATLQI